MIILISSLFKLSLILIFFIFFKNKYILFNFVQFIWVTIWCYLTLKILLYINYIISYSIYIFLEFLNAFWLLFEFYIMFALFLVYIFDDKAWYFCGIILTWYTTVWNYCGLFGYCLNIFYNFGLIYAILWILCKNFILFMLCHEILCSYELTYLETNCVKFC